MFRIYNMFENEGVKEWDVIRNRTIIHRIFCTSTEPSSVSTFFAALNRFPLLIRVGLSFILCLRFLSMGSINGPLAFRFLDQLLFSHHLVF